MSCTGEELALSHNHCAYAMENCTSESIINFYVLYYCNLHEKAYYGGPLSVFSLSKFIGPCHYFSVLFD